MRTLVTGAAGFIGSVVAEKLIENGHDVVVYDSLKYGHRAAVHPQAKFVEGDIRNSKLFYETCKTHEIEAVIHLAAEAYIEESVIDPGIFFEVNNSAGLQMLMAMRDLGIKKMVFSSTAAVYGEPKSIPIRESDQKFPVNSYGESKLHFEQTMKWFHQAHGLNHVSLRYFNACGATENYGEDRKKETHIIPIIFDAAEGKRSTFSLFGTDYDTKDGSCIRDYVHVEDIALAHIASLNKIEELGERAYNLGSGAGFSNKEVIEAAKKVTGVNFNVIESPRRTGDPATLIASFEKIQGELNWTPKWTDVQKMIESSWKWRKNHPAGYTK